MRIAIVDYGMGNISSVHNAFERLGCEVITSFSPDAVAGADALVLPGVGAFGEAVQNLNSRGLTAPLRAAVRETGKPLLGICLGMQLLASESEERGRFRGLDLIPGSICRIPVPEGFRLPHIGWNVVRPRGKTELFAGIRPDSTFYFVHSYCYEGDPGYVAAVTDYGSNVAAAIRKDRVFGVQFHPERSQSNGLALLENFVRFAAGARPRERISC